MGNKDKGKRAQEKCSECRKQRVKCEPLDRDWDAKREKCEKCSIRGLDCGPNVRKRDDPATNPSRDEKHSNEPASSSSTHRSTSRSPHESYTIEDDQSMKITEHKEGKRRRISKDREARSLPVINEELKRKSRSRLARLNAVGDTWVHNSNVTPTHCGAPHLRGYEKPKTITGKLEGEFHTLFLKIFCMVGSLESDGNEDLANLLMVKLLLALEKFPGLCDDQKRGPLLEMASLFKKFGDLDEYRHVLGKVADMKDPPVLPIEQNYCQLLADSLIEIDSTLLIPFWKKHFTEINMPSDRVIPPPQRAAQYCNPKVIENILSRPNSINAAPAISNLEAVHIAAAKGNLDTLSTLIKKAYKVDVRDAQNQTPLFLAAAYGHKDCCLLLLQRGANPNSRDYHGHTIVEVACKRGNLSIVKMLVANGANLHANVAGCASTPLQAAIESGDPSGELVQYLLTQKVEISLFRSYDNQTALSLAENRGLQQVVSQLKDSIPHEEPGFFGHYHSS